MARLLPLLLFLAMVVTLVLKVRGFGQPPRAGNTYRPRPKWWGPFGAGGDRPGGRPGTVHIVSRRELAGVRDAYSSAAIDPVKPVVRCGGCQAFYHAASLDALQRDNDGRCAVCGGTDFGPVRLAED